MHIYRVLHGGEVVAENATIAWGPDGTDFTMRFPRPPAINAGEQLHFENQQSSRTFSAKAMGVVIDQRGGFSVLCVLNDEPTDIE